MTRRLLNWVLCLTCAATWPVLAQENQWNERIRELSFLGGASDEYRLGPGDLIEISVFGVENLSQTVRVSAGGTISLPFVGEVTVADSTTGEIALRLKQLLDGRFVKDPQVSVFIREHRSHPVFILGAVHRPGQYQMTERLALIDIIAMAGGLDLSRAADEATIRRKHAGTGDPDGELIRINLHDLLEKGNLALNVSVQGGDVIHVPEREVAIFYVIGEVNRPGAFSLQDSKPVLLTQALAQAGGPMKTAKMNEGILVRYDQQGTRQQVEVNFKDILAGKKTDFSVQKDDVIFIPGSTFKNIAYGLLGVIPSTVSSAIVQGPVTR